MVAYHCTTQKSKKLKNVYLTLPCYLKPTLSAASKGWSMNWWPTRKSCGVSAWQSAASVLTVVIGRELTVAGLADSGEGLSLLGSKLITVCKLFLSYCECVCLCLCVRTPWVRVCACVRVRACVCACVFCSALL